MDNLNTPLNPFVNRPWMTHLAAASAVSGGSMGLKGFIAGGITGGLKVYVTRPHEYVKTQLPLDVKGDLKQYNGILDGVIKTIKKLGSLSLYRRILSDLPYGPILRPAVRFGVFEELKSRSLDCSGTLSPLSSLLCGLGAGVCEAIFAVTPMETIKVKFINDQRSGAPKYKGYFHGVREMIRTDGIRGTLKGLNATIIRQGSNQAVRFCVMDSCKDWYRKGDPKAHVPLLVVGAFGVVAGAASVLVTKPLNVVKHRMQGLRASTYKNLVLCGARILKHEGPAALYKGALPRLARVCPDVAITFMLYDSAMELLK